MKIEKNGLCPCGSGEKYKRCCGRDAQTQELVRAAIHELGHLSVLPLDIDSHVSLRNPCELCAGQEGLDESIAHTGYPEDVCLNDVEEILYSLAGGAAEVACGLSPAMGPSELGTLPTSMGTDLENLKAELPNEIWEVLNPVRTHFMAIVNHFSDKADFLWHSSRALREKGALKSPQDIDLAIMDHVALITTMKRRWGMD